MKPESVRCRYCSKEEMERVVRDEEMHEKFILPPEGWFLILGKPVTVHYCSEQCVRRDTLNMLDLVRTIVEEVHER